MNKLIKGLHRFQTEVFPHHKDFFENLGKGQHPEALFITCSDSRINPNLVTSTLPGDLFIMRNAGAIVPPFGDDCGQEATIEFAVTGLKVDHIIICGHFLCGAIQSAITPNTLASMPAVKTWVEKYIGPTVSFVKESFSSLGEDELINLISQAHVLAQIEQIKSHPSVQKRLQEGSITIHGWLYDFETGQIYAFDSAEEQFKPLSIDSLHLTSK